ncbi:MAG: prenyltransferase, partial [Bdellovibrionales bacterium]
RQVMWAGGFCLLLAFIFGVPLVVVGGLPIVVIGLVSLAMTYAYTGGPYPLAYRGLGDLFVFLFFGLIAVGGMVLLHIGRWPVDAMVAGAQTGLLGTVLIAINNFRDHQQDLKVGKWTLAARFGARFARTEIICLLITAYALCFWWLWTGRVWAMALPLLSLPLAFKVARGVLNHEPSPIFNRFLGQAAGTQLVFGTLLALGLIL